jgi:hypothetical protein
MSKESEITQLKAALQEEKHANGRLRADIKLKSQDLKVQEEKVRATEEQRQNVIVSRSHIIWNCVHNLHRLLSVFTKNGKITSIISILLCCQFSRPFVG